MKTYDLNLLRTLDAVLATGSVTAAAGRLHLSVPAASHSLARLREVMGDPILVRAGRKLAPTPRALELKDAVTQLLAQAQAFVTPPTLRDLKAARRTFVVRAPDGMVVAYGAAVATALQEAMPRSTLNFVPEAHGDVSALRDGRIDLDIGMIRTKDPEVQVAELYEQALVGAVRQSHALAKGPRTAKRFAAQTHVAVARRPGEVSLVGDALAALGLERFVALTVPNSYAALVIAARADVVVTVPERMARVMGTGMGLVVFKLPFEVTGEPMVMAWHPRHGADPPHAWLRGLFKQLLSGGQWVAPSMKGLGLEAAPARKQPASP